MQRINNPFIYYYPSVDLHGYDRISAVIKVKEFICDCIKLKKYDIIIIHGRGTGILKSSVHEFLSKDKNVLSFKLDNMNDGMTIVKLRS